MKPLLHQQCLGVLKRRLNDEGVYDCQRCREVVTIGVSTPMDRGRWTNTSGKGSYTQLETGVTGRFRYSGGC